MKIKFEHLIILVIMAIFVGPNIVWAGSSVKDEWKNKIPRDPFNSTYRVNDRVAVVICEYPDAIGSCKYDTKQSYKFGCEDPIEFDIRDYIGKDKLTIRTVIYKTSEYNAQGLIYSDAKDYSICADGRKDNSTYCYQLDKSQEVLEEMENEYKDNLSAINLYHGYVPFAFTEEDFLSRIEDSGSCPNIWKKCENGWSRFYLTNEPDSKLLEKHSYVKKYDYGADLGITTCSSLLGNPKNSDSPAYFLGFAFRVVRFVAIILLIVLSALDFLQSTTSQDSEEVKKAFTKTMKRFVLCILIFVLPILLEFVLSIINDKEVDICISTSNEEGIIPVYDTTETPEDGSTTP